jgi:hypothetical protein
LPILDIFFTYLGKVFRALKRFEFSLGNEISFSCPATQSQKYPGNFLEIMQNTKILDVMHLSVNQKVHVLNPSAGKLLALKKA